MGKLLKTMVVVLLIFSIGALALGILLFNKRELLKGRTQKLERTIIALGTTVETQAAEPRAAVYPAKDVSDCTAQQLDTPERSDFWDRYKSNLEVQDSPKLDLNPKKVQLMQYYQLDPVTLQPTRDPTTGLKMTSGPGTMQEILDDQLAKSAAQLARLNETRQQLTDLREELVRSITELNERKGTLRARLKDIVDLNGKIAGLEAKIRQLEGEIDGLKQEKRALETQVADLQGQVDKANQEKADLEELNNKLKKEIKDLREGKGVTPQPTMASGEVIQRIVRMEPGDKGEVLAVNPTWNFVVVKLSDECLGEVFDEQGILTPVELYVKRAPAKEGKEDKFITKIRLIQASRSQKVGIADILSDWQQAPVQDGDVIFR
jgi:cell division protein FtsB